MAKSIALSPGSIIVWNGKTMVIVDYADLEHIVAQEVGKRKYENVAVREVRGVGDRRKQKNIAPNLVQISKEAWDVAFERYEAVRPLLQMDTSSRTYADVAKVAKRLGKHPTTLYRWMNDYVSHGRVSVFVRKERSDQGKSRLTERVEEIIRKAIKDVYLTEEQPDVAAVIEEVKLKCAKRRLEPPHANTIRRRVATLSDRLKLEKRKGKKAAAERFDPIQGHFPGANFPLAVVQIDHTPMDVIVVDEEHRKPIQRPNLTIAIDVDTRVVEGFSIYLEKPSAFTTGLTIAHAVLPKEQWLTDVGVDAEWPVWGKMRKIHMDNAKEFRGTVIGRACVEHEITVEHRPKGRPNYGGHIERGFRTFMRRVHRLKGTTFSNIQDRGDYDSSGKAQMTRRELEKWFTIYIVKYYCNNFHRGIKNTPIAKWKEGILGTDSKPGIGLPDRISDPRAFMLDFMPFEERTVQEYGVVIDHVYYMNDALRPYIHAPDPKDMTKPRKFMFRYIPRDMSEIYFWDPNSRTYIDIPYRDPTHPAVSRWEIVAAGKRLLERGYANFDESLLFEAIEDMRLVEAEAQHKSKSARRSREKLSQTPALPARINRQPAAPDPAPPIPSPPTPKSAPKVVEAYEFVEPE